MKTKEELISELTDIRKSNSNLACFFLNGSTIERNGIKYNHIYEAGFADGNRDASEKGKLFFTLNVWDERWHETQLLAEELTTSELQAILTGTKGLIEWLNMK